MPSKPSELRAIALQRAPVNDADEAAIAAFLDALWSENGVAQATLESYRSDLEGLARWRDGRGGGIATADRAVLFDYFAERTHAGYSARSNSRLLSTLRAFYAHCVRRRDREDDPTALIDPPRLPRSLPKALSETEIDALLSAPAIDDPIGLRDRAMFELMYACGLRVSELCNLPSTGLNLRQGVLRVMGKGSKERLVPLGEEAQHWLERYLSESRPKIAGKRALSPLFLEHSGEPPSRHKFWMLVKQYAVKAGIDPRRISPHGLRHSFQNLWREGGSPLC